MIVTLGPQLAPLADMTLSVCDFNNLGSLGKDSKTFCEMTDIMPLYQTVLWLVVLGL